MYHFGDTPSVAPRPKEEGNAQVYETCLEQPSFREHELTPESSALKRIIEKSPATNTQTVKYGNWVVRISLPDAPEAHDRCEIEIVAPTQPKRAQQLAALLPSIEVVSPEQIRDVACSQKEDGHSVLANNDFNRAVPDTVSRHLVQASR